MTESELYKNLGTLTKSKDQWEKNIPYVASLLSSESTKIKAKALWLLGEMGLKFPLAIKDSIPAIASFCDSEEPLLRERAVNALGRIGRGCYSSVEPFWDRLFRFAHDEGASVRLAFIWASENVATNTPDPYKDYLPLFAELLHPRQVQTGALGALFGFVTQYCRNRQQSRGQDSLFRGSEGDEPKMLIISSPSRTATAFLRSP